MSIVGRNLLAELIHTYKCIYPFDYSLLDGDGYILTVRAETTLNYLEHQNITSHEVIFTPPGYVAHLTAKSQYGRMGLSFLNSVKVHSGFVGRLALELVNLNNERQPIIIKKGAPIIHIEFVKREGQPSPYDGDYMFQYMTQDESDLYLRIIQENFKESFEKMELEKTSKKRIQ